MRLVAEPACDCVAGGNDMPVGPAGQGHGVSAQRGRKIAELDDAQVAGAGVGSGHGETACALDGCGKDAARWAAKHLRGLLDANLLREAWVPLEEFLIHKGGYRQHCIARRGIS